MRFYLGTHETSWLGKLDVPLFVSHKRLRKRRSLPTALAPWALDSGGFTELRDHGRWTFGVDEYVEAVARYQGIGRMQWAAPMDWMCEPFITRKTGLGVREHQERTVSNYLELRHRGPFIPVLQGWELADYERCVDLYGQAGVDIAAEPVVGVGSVCRRQSTEEIARIVLMLYDAGISVHGFGVKKDGLRRYAPVLTSADSMAWSFGARNNDPLPGCTHQSCANCWRYALRWRNELLADVPEAIRPVQMELAA